VTPIAIAFEKIATRAAEENVPFLIIGGHAVVTHGYARNTFDLDIVIRREDREKWSALVGELGYAFLREGPTFLQYNPSEPLNLPLDLMMVNEETFAKLAAQAVPSPLSKTARCVSLLHLLALKCHAIKHSHKGRIEKDVNDVLHLVEINRLDVTQPEIREMFLRFGPKELYEKLQRSTHR
jgi:hypothetical protein